jgi:pimeloyl-ACP methyl ester carboxylesterase
VAFWTAPDETSLAEYEALCMPLYTHTARPAGFYERAVRNPAMRLVFFETELLRLDLLKQLDRIKCPTLLVAGEDDPITPLADMEDLAAAIRPDLVRLERFASAGHGVYRDRPEAFFSILRDFIRV